MEAMFYYVLNEILQVPGVLDTFPQKDLANKGRWNIMNDTTHFKAVTAALEINLTSWTRLYCDKENITLGSLPPPILSIQNTTIGRSFRCYLFYLHVRIYKHVCTPGRLLRPPTPIQSSLSPIVVSPFYRILCRSRLHKQHLTQPDFSRSILTSLHMKTPVSVGTSMNSLLKFLP